MSTKPIKVSERERACLKLLAEEYDQDANCLFFGYMAKETGLDRRQVRRSCRALARKGLAQYERGLINMNTGMLAGSGYCATTAGAALINPCDVCGGYITYEYLDEKSGQKIRECDRHFKDSPKHQIPLTV